MLGCGAHMQLAHQRRLCSGARTRATGGPPLLNRCAAWTGALSPLRLEHAGWRAVHAHRRAIPATGAAGSPRLQHMAPIPALAPLPWHRCKPPLRASPDGLSPRLRTIIGFCKGWHRGAHAERAAANESHGYRPAIHVSGTGGSSSQGVWAAGRQPWRQSPPQASRAIRQQPLTG